ncbi:MAG: cellulase family glycosylhydrolase [Melioribacteraceae bacterium]|nr:cellulase family glycosylhydrolase [Melioribacteraceae bacterium]
MKFKVFVFSLLVGVLLISCTQKTEKEVKVSEGFVIEKGLNASHWISQSEKRGEERENYMTEKDFKIIADLGFDHVRLPIDEEQMWNEAGEKEADAFQLMHNAIEWSFKHNLRVIVDLHVLRSHHFNNPDNRQLWEDKTAQEGFIKFWKELSAELKKYPNNKLAYEPLNEAVSDNPEDWNNLINWVISEIRKLEPERTIIMGSNNWQTVGSFKDLRVPENDKNIILSFHYYEPFLLTHYQAGWTPLKDLNVPVNYPGTLIKKDDYKKMDKDLAEKVKTYNQVFDKEAIEKEILQAVVVAKKFDLKLFCGEFGCFPSSDISIRHLWYKDIIAVFEKHNIAWSHWNYKNDFPVVDKEMKPISEIIDVMIPKK